MGRRNSIERTLKATSAALLALGLISSASAGSIQQPGLTTGLPEGYGMHDGLYSVTALNYGSRSTSPDSTQMGVVIPTFLTWSTPWEVAGARVMFKAAPVVYVSMDSQRLQVSSSYSSYYGAWFSWYLGNGYNLAIGEGVQVGRDSEVNTMTGRNFSAFQQNVALTYAKDNWNITGNSFYTDGRTRASGSQPRTLNLDLTAIKRAGRFEYGMVGYGQWDLNKPSVGYGEKQSEIAVGGLLGYLIGNQVSAQVKLTTNLHERNIGGRDTRFWLQVIVPIFTPPAPNPSKAY